MLGHVVALYTSIRHSLRLSVGLCVCPVHCGKTADRIWMRFGMVSQMGPWIRQVDGFGDWSTGEGNLGANVWHPIVTNGELDTACFQSTLGNCVFVSAGVVMPLSSGVEW